MRILRTPLFWPAALAGIDLAFWVYGARVESPFTWFYIPVTFAYALLIAWLTRQLPLSVVVALTFGALGNLVGGVLIVDGDQLYTLQLAGPIRFDDLQHTFAGGMVGWACWALLGARLPKGLRAFAAIFIAAGLGTIVEMVEFIGWNLFETNVGGYTDAMGDLVSNITGAALAVALLSRRPQPS